MSDANTEDTFTIELTGDELNALTFAIGIAAGAALPPWAVKIPPSWLRLVNKINCDNPHFTPYEVEE